MTNPQLVHVYYIPPIDFYWEYVPTVKETAKKMLEQAELDDASNWMPSVIANFFANFETAKRIAKQVGWEGDFRGSPCVFFMPGETEFTYGFVWKQDNNGDCLVVSPYKLPWMSTNSGYSDNNYKTIPARWAK
jgi:hypothetical protein